MPKATSEISRNGATTTVRVTRRYPAGVPPTGPRVWAIAANFGGLKTIFPNLVRVYVTYPDAKDSTIGTLRDMTFVVPGPYPLAGGIEQLVELDDRARRLKYVSLAGLPVGDYASVMEVAGEDACTLTWTSTFTWTGGQGPPDFPTIMAGILAGGADQIAAALGLDSRA
jgi:hypothetical protein